MSSEGFKSWQDESEGTKQEKSREEILDEKHLERENNRLIEEAREKDWPEHVKKNQESLKPKPGDQLDLF